jgi:N-acetylglucosamine kinase-like BadF-type ATPase
MAEYFLGVDGGQSSTVALIGDHTGGVLGAGRAGPSNHVGESEGRAKFVGAIKECLTAACAEARLDFQTIRFKSAYLGFSGGPADKETILREVLASDRTTVTHDALIALSGATAGNPGVVTIAGTGSMAFGRNAANKTARAGGWGYVYGDEGGGFWIVRQALRAALRFEEGWGPATALHAILLNATGARDANDLLHRFYTPEFPRPQIAAFSKRVDEAAEAGDASAKEILNDAAQQLAAIAAAVRAQLFTAGESVRVSYIGGVFHSRTILDRFRSLVEAGAGNTVSAPIHGPAAGALLEAYRTAGIHCTLSNAPLEKNAR